MVSMKMPLPIDLLPFCHRVYPKSKHLTRSTRTLFCASSHTFAADTARLTCASSNTMLTPSRICPIPAMPEIAAQRMERPLGGRQGFLCPPLRRMGARPERAAQRPVPVVRPQGRSIELFTDEDILAAADELNGRPRRKLDHCAPENSLMPSWILFTQPERLRQPGHGWSRRLCS